MSKLTNHQVLQLATTQRTGKSYFVESLGEIRNYDLQKCVQDNDELLKAESKKIRVSLTATFGEKPYYSSPDEIAVLEAESGIEFRKITIKEEQIRAWSPNYDMLFCIKLIQK